MARHGEDLQIIHAALDDHVHLNGKSGGPRGGDSRQHEVGMLPTAVHGTEDRRVERVEADGDAPESCPRKTVGEGGQQEPVGCHGHILEELEFPEPFQEFHHAGAQQRLSSRDAELPHPAADEGADDPVQFREADEFLLEQEGVVVAEDRRRHAVGAAEVATIRQRDA